jgi:hypothetical protein
MSPTAKPKPVNNIADLNKPIWKGLAAKPQWSRLTPLTEFAEAEGEKSSKTRTWCNVKDQPIFAWGAFLPSAPKHSIGIVCQEQTFAAADRKERAWSVAAVPGKQPATPASQSITSKLPVRSQPMSGWAGLGASCRSAMRPYCVEKLWMGSKALQQQQYPCVGATV